MARRKKHAQHENHERWLVSYADFITLLFAFFVVMFATSQTDKGKAQRVSDSIKRALEEDQFAAAVAGILGGTVGKKDKGNSQMKGPGGADKMSVSPGPAENDGGPAPLAQSLELLRAQLKEEIANGMLQVKMEARGLVVSLQQAAFFPSGQDTVDPGTFHTLEKLAATLAKLPNKIRLEGHTDSVPIRTSKFRSNWDLSSARGVVVLELLQTRYEIPAARLSVGGYGETIPVDTNDTVEGRAHNRRVDIVILNELGMHGEPVKDTGVAAPKQAAPPAPIFTQPVKTH
ncbi:MAG: flagellar motor protein MotB [Bryobacteraceae bacterium]